MQKRFFSTEFFVILLFFVLPPIVFSQTMPAERTVQFSWMTFALAAVAGIVWWQVKVSADYTASEKKSGLKKQWRFFMHQAAALVTFGILVILAIIIEVAGHMVLHIPEETKLLAPETTFGWVNVLTGTMCAAFYEEVLYRAYLPYAMKIVCTKKDAPQESVKTKRMSLVCEGLCIVLFALAHRYAGILAVVNALFGGFVLRRCFLRTNALWTTVAAHTAYNFVMLGIMLA